MSDLFYHIVKDEKLRRLVGAHGESDWERISLYFATKTESQCQAQWEKVPSESIKAPWSQQV